MDPERIKAILLFPIRDTYARKQFLIASLMMLLGMIIPIVPIFFLMGYGARIARQVVLDKREPSMTAWDDWSGFFTDGVRIFGIRMIITLPLTLLLVTAIFSLVLAPILVSTLNPQTARELTPLAGLAFLLAVGFILVLGILAIPLQLLVGAAETHVAVKGSFSAGLQFKEWWPILRKGMGSFLLVYAIVFVLSFVFMIAVQISAATIILICILPLIMFPYSAYLLLILQTLFAQAYSQALTE